MRNLAKPLIPSRLRIPKGPDRAPPPDVGRSVDNEVRLEATFQGCVELAFEHARSRAPSRPVASRLHMLFLRLLEALRTYGVIERVYFTAV
jgi:hypothetical protein